MAFPPPAPLPGTALPFGGGDVESGATMRFSPAALQREIAEREAGASAGTTAPEATEDVPTPAAESPAGERAADAPARAAD
ncbi:hypothetical protein BU197_22495, partial [Streptomyces sp. CBMA291]|nr:hypothetical protein [Streptomyces sp. CBMA291]